MAQLRQRISRQPTLAVQVQDALRDDIKAGRLASGERIVVERIAERLGVSPTPVREAVISLVQEGLIREDAVGRLHVVRLTRTYVLNTFLVRSALEGLAAELAATQMPDADIAKLQAMIERTGPALERGEFETYVDSDHTLHRMIRQASDNATLARELEMIATHVEYIREYSQRRAGDHLARSHQEHRIIVAALARRDAAAARQAMEQHIRQAGARIAHLIEFEQGLAKQSTKHPSVAPDT